VCICVSFVLIQKGLDPQLCIPFYPSPPSPFVAVPIARSTSARHHSVHRVDALTHVRTGDSTQSVISRFLNTVPCISFQLDFEKKTPVDTAFLSRPFSTRVHHDLHDLNHLSTTQPPMTPPHDTIDILVSVSMNDSTLLASIGRRYPAHSLLQAMRLYVHSRQGSTTYFVFTLFYQSTTTATPPYKPQSHLRTL
jgi:hypothetical protein